VAEEKPQLLFSFEINDVSKAVSRLDEDERESVLVDTLGGNQVSL
jgi:hypothetical protein